MYTYSKLYNYTNKSFYYYFLNIFLLPYRSLRTGCSGSGSASCCANSLQKTKKQMIVCCMLCAQWTKLLPEHILKRHKNVLLQSTTTNFFFITVCLLLCCVKSMWNTFLVVSFFLNTINYKNTLFVPVNWSPQSSIGVTLLHKVYTLWLGHSNL